ncbi:MAG: hypothetical protein MJZ61_06135 [Bacteroidales bacterium]|nr:hypothetical protein [Bacteroidales bacterium]
MTRIQTILLILMLCVSSAKAQDSAMFADGEERIARLMDKALAAESDSVRKAMAYEAANELSYLLDNNGAFEYQFPGLPNFSSVYSENHKVRVITFGTALSRGRYIYHGYVMYCHNTKVTITRLYDDQGQTPNPDKANMQANNWLGAIYYEISQFGSKKNPVYALCGWDGHSMITNRKVLEQMTIDYSGKPVFGGRFQTSIQKGRQEVAVGGFSRMIFTYNEKATMSLKYDKRLKMVVADHLSVNPGMENNPTLKGPDFSFDGYGYKDGEWFYVGDVDAKLNY